MRLQDYRVGWRILARDPLYSLVSVAGLGIALGVCLLLLSYARYCWQYNSHIPDADNVYILKHRDNLALGAPWHDQVPLLLLSAAGTAPGVLSASAYVGWCPLTAEVHGQLRDVASLTVLPGFAEVMGLRALEGDLNEALSRPDAIAITAGAAARLFGTPDVLGRSVQLRLSAVDENRGTVRIAAILPDPPANTTIPFETLNGPASVLVPQLLREELLGASIWRGYVLVRLRPDASPAAVGDALQRAVDQAPGVQRISPEMKQRLAGGRVMDIRLSRLRDAYFDHEVVSDWLSLPVERGDSSVVAGLVAIAVLILVLAAVNYVNLATLRVLRRQREIATRKVLGASNARLARQFIAESLLVSMLAAAAGFALASLALPVFAELMNRDLGSMVSGWNIGTALGLGVALGLITATYPAWSALRVRPSLMLMGRPETESPGSKRLRQALSLLQVSAAMGLASFALGVYWQARFAIEASPGFDPAPLLVFDLPRGFSARDEKPRGLMAALSQRAEVAGVAVSNDQVGRSQDSRSIEIRRDAQPPVAIDVMSVSANFFEQYGIGPSAGRLFAPAIDREADPVPIVVNAIAARQLGFESPPLAIGQSLQFGGTEGGSPVLITRRIVGVAPEIRFRSLREMPRPIVYELWGSGAGWDGTLTVRASGTTADAARAIRELWPRYFPNSLVEIKTAKEVHAANYADDARLARLLSFSTAIAMAIAAFGVYVFAADAVQRRTKEIALRKLFGTRRRDIGGLVAMEIGAVILLAAVLALPLAALAIVRYLAVYTEWTPLAFWALAVALLVSLATAALAGARQAWIAMTVKPAVALRS